MEVFLNLVEKKIAQVLNDHFAEIIVDLIIIKLLFLAWALLVICVSTLENIYHPLGESIISLLVLFVATRDIIANCLVVLNKLFKS